MREFNYKAETFEIGVDGKKYPINTSKMVVIKKMESLCNEYQTKAKPDIIGFCDKLYECLEQILGKVSFGEIFDDRKYDIVFLTEFCVYLSQEAAPHYNAIMDRFKGLSEKYGKENLNEPVDPQTAGQG